MLHSTDIVKFLRIFSHFGLNKLIRDKRFRFHTIVKEIDKNIQKQLLNILLVIEGPGLHF